jgi:hypothetical protein
MYKDVVIFGAFLPRLPGGHRRVFDEVCEEARWLTRYLAGLPTFKSKALQFGADESSKVPRIPPHSPTSLWLYLYMYQLDVVVQLTHLYILPSPMHTSKSDK